MGYNVVSPKIDYESCSLEQIYDRLSYEAHQNNIHMIVANSLGAFIGKRLSVELDVPCIFTNPCFRPDMSLKLIDPGYYNTISNEVERWIIDQKSYDFSKDIVIIGDQDEVIDHYSITLFEAPEATFYHVEDGYHNVDIDKYGELIKNSVQQIVDYQN